VVLGFPTLAGYTGRADHYFGAVIGRYANRIARGRFALDGVEYRLAPNEGAHVLHGGRDGFDRRVWKVMSVELAEDGPRVVFGYRSPDGEMGFPGTLTVEVSYRLDLDGALWIDYRATSDRPTVVNLTSHPLWNLAGEGSGTIERHLLAVSADRFAPIDPELIPTGELAAVAGTPFDFTGAASIGAGLETSCAQLDRARGYDHTLVLRRDPSTAALIPAARLVDPGSGRILEIETTEPGLQVYSGNSLDGTLIGAGGRPYGRHGGIALETQHFPDSPNRADFPSTVLRPGELYASTTVYRFPPPSDLGLSRA
jgi:aldose 1-epimerase